MARALLLPSSALALMLTNPAWAEPYLVPEASPERIDISPGFRGGELLLFGAIANPGTSASSSRIDIIVALRGPSEAIIVREKSKLGGLIWANAASASFRSAPAYYAVASSRPLNLILDDRTAAIYEIGLQNLHLSPAGTDTPATRERFEHGLVDLRRRQELYVYGPRAVMLSQGVLYRAHLPIPSSVPTGTYTAETFMVRNGRVIAAASRDVEVRKIGFERAVASAATRWPMLYGMGAVTLSLLFGWLAGALFRRR